MVTEKEFDIIMKEFKSIKQDMRKSERRTTFILLAALFLFCSGPFMDKSLTLAFLALFVGGIVVWYVFHYKIKIE